MLKAYDVTHVFGLPGETTLPFYKEWLSYPEIRHVMARDERSTSFMADAYARFSYKPGICEAPSVGATHVLPGVAEAFKASVPMIILTSDIPLHLKQSNMLTGIDQTSLFKGVTKETMTITHPAMVPGAIRRAFRLATTGKTGPVHIRLPHDIQSMEVGDPKPYTQKDFARYPGHRPTAQEDKIVEALKLLGEAETPFIVLGQGALFSQAWDEVIELAERLAIPVGTTINGKGAMPETHPLSVGVVGARGGTGWGNRMLCEADTVFFIGSSTDSAGTDKWTVPPRGGDARFIQLDVSEAELGNNYNVDVFLMGDAKATLQTMLKLMDYSPRDMMKQPRVQRLAEHKREHAEYVADMAESSATPIHPLRFIKELREAIPEEHAMVMDVGTVAIYTSTYFKTRKPGRSMAYNFAMGSLGYAIPAGVGASHAKPDACTVTLAGDGSFGLTAGELETIARVGLNNNVILVNNSSFGWIRAEWSLSFGPEYTDFATNFGQVDYMKIGEGFGLNSTRVTKPEELHEALSTSFSSPEPSFIELVLQPEDKLVPPVPKWIREAKKRGLPYIE